MKTLLLLAVLGFVLPVGCALPFSEDEVQNDELKDFARDLETENPDSDYGINTEDEEFDDEDFEDDDKDQDEDETAEDEGPAVEDNEDGIYGNDNDDDTAVEKLSDPRPFRIGGVLKRVQRGAIRVGRKISRRASRVGRTVGRTVGRVVRRGARTVGRKFRRTVKPFRRERG